MECNELFEFWDMHDQLPAHKPPLIATVQVALEYMGGGSLTAILEMNIILTEPQIAYVCRESLEALDYIHRMHRMHRDIKSDNILLGDAGEVKLGV